MESKESNTIDAHKIDFGQTFQVNEQWMIERSPNGLRYDVLDHGRVSAYAEFDMGSAKWSYFETSTTGRDVRTCTGIRYMSELNKHLANYIYSS